MPTRLEEALKTPNVTNDVLWHSIILDVRDVITKVAYVYQFELPKPEVIDQMSFQIHNGMSKMVTHGFEVRPSTIEKLGLPYDDVPEVVLYNKVFNCAPRDVKSTIVRIHSTVEIPLAGFEPYKHIRSLVTKHRSSQ